MGDSASGADLIPRQPRKHALAAAHHYSRPVSGGTIGQRALGAPLPTGQRSGHGLAERTGVRVGFQAETIGHRGALAAEQPFSVGPGVSR